jgi:pimeloyl-ACP methyl ester carboxylesterase
VICSSPFDSELHTRPADSSHGEGTEADEADEAGPPEPDLADREQAIAYLIEGTRGLTGTAYPFDEAAIRRLAEQDVDRADHFPSATNHFQIGGSKEWDGRLGEIKPPLLVLHGTADPLFTRAHGIEFAERVPGTTLVWLEGVGHELPEPAWDEIIAEIARHTATDQAG